MKKQKDCIITINVNRDVLIKAKHVIRKKLHMSVSQYLNLMLKLTCKYPKHMGKWLKENKKLLKKGNQK